MQTQRNEQFQLVLFVDLELAPKHHIVHHEPKPKHLALPLVRELNEALYKLLQLLYLHR